MTSLNNLGQHGGKSESRFGFADLATMHSTFIVGVTNLASALGITGAIV